MKLLSLIAAATLSACTLSVTTTSVAAAPPEWVVETDFGNGHATHAVYYEPNQPQTAQPNDIQFFVRSYLYFDNGTTRTVDQRITWEFDGYKSGEVTEHSGPRQRLLFEELESLVPQVYTFSTAGNYNFDAVVIQLNILTNGRGLEAYNRAIGWTRDSEVIDPALLVEDNWGETLMNVVWAMYGLKWDNGNWTFQSYDETHDMRHVFVGSDPLNMAIDGSFPRNLSAHNEEVRYRSFDEDRMTAVNTWARVND